MTDHVAVAQLGDGDSELRGLAQGSRSVAARVAVKRRGEIEAWEVTGECAPPLGVVFVGAGNSGWAIVYAVTWSPLATNSRPPPALGLAKWLTLDPFSGIGKWLLVVQEVESSP